MIQLTYMKVVVTYMKVVVTYMKVVVTYMKVVVTHMKVVLVVTSRLRLNKISFVSCSKRHSVNIDFAATE